MKLLSLIKELSLHPKNAEELKGLVLQLAIQGKLTAKWREKNSNVASVSNLLESIENEKSQQIKQKIIKAEKTSPTIEADEMSFNIPNTWVWKRLGEVGSTNVGLTYKPAHKVNDGVPVLRSSNIQDGDLCLKDLVRVNTDYRDKDVIKEGDLLICARNGSRRLVGKCTIIGPIDEVMVFGAFMAIYRSLINPYIQLFIQSPQYRSKLDGVETTTINQITQGNLKATTAPIPPLEEQKAIVEVVNQLFTEVEQLEELTKERISLKEDFVTSALRRLTETDNTTQEWNYLQQHFSSFFTKKKNIKSLRETILQLAVQGKLTAQWREANPSVENASELLKRIETEKQQLIAEKKIKKEKLLPPIDDEDIPYNLPAGWVWCRLGGAGFTQTGSTPPKKNPEYYGNFIPFIGPADISNQWMKYPKEGLSEKGIAVGRLIPENSTMMVCIGGSIGKCYINEIDVSCNQQINTITPIYNLPVMIRTICQSPYFQNEVWENSSGSATPIINKGKWEKIVVPIPPLKEQQAIVEKVNSLMALCDELEQHIDNSQTQIEQLMQSCLKEVFVEESN